MPQLLTLVLNFIFPPDRADIEIDACTDTLFQRRYRTHNIQQMTVLASYKDPLVRTVITKNKFHHNQKAAHLLACLLDTWLLEHPGKYIFVPIPLSTHRKRTRGYNQVMSVLTATKASLHIEKWLQRNVDTVPQTSLQKNEREQNVRNAFVCKPNTLEIPEGTVVVLFDDVVTTGATMKAARAELSAHLPSHTKLICLALAH